MNNAATELQAMRTLVDHTCPECDTSFVDLKVAVYCSNTCKRRAKYARRKAREADE